MQSPLDHSTLALPSAAHYHFNETNATDVQISATLSYKKQRSDDSPLSGAGPRFGTRLPSFSKKWKNKTGASPKLSIVTHSDPTRSRTNSVSSQLVSPALSVISQHGSLFPSSPVQAGHEESPNAFGPSPIDIEQANSQAEEDRGQATTPLLPPTMMGLTSHNVPVQSPLQSPAIADLLSLPSSATSSWTPQLSCLPSPPLSTKPSLVSIRQRSRAGTVVPTPEVPSRQMLGECFDDEWSAKLGHANFIIHPFPYSPSVLDVDTVKQLREDWNQARHSYARHLARTGEHYGGTSKTYLLTEEKWSSIDTEWKRNMAAAADTLGLLLSRSSSGDAEASNSPSSSTILEESPTKVIVPTINDPSGKFPDMGNEDIVGPMAVGPSLAITRQQVVEPAFQNRLPKKRNFLRFISDILARGTGSGLRT